MKHKVQQEITTRKKVFYGSKVQHLRKDDCRRWWKFVNKMSGKSDKKSYISLERNGITLNQSELVNSLNEFYVSVNIDIPPLDVTVLPAFLTAVEPVQSVNTL